MYSTLEQAQIHALKETARKLGFNFADSQAGTSSNEPFKYAKDSFNRALESYLSRQALGLITTEASDRISELETRLETQAQEHEEAVKAIEAKISEMGALS